MIKSLYFVQDGRHQEEDAEPQGWNHWADRQASHVMPLITQCQINHWSVLVGFHHFFRMIRKVNFELSSRLENSFCKYFLRSTVDWVGNPFVYVAWFVSIFERCLDSNPESFRRKQARYQLSHPSHYLAIPISGT